MQITGYEKIESSKKIEICFDNRIHIRMYPGDAKKLCLRLGLEVSEEQYQQIIHEILGKRAAKRAMHLLERMERTEYQLREKLKQNDYPPEAIEDAVSYVKKYHYLDDKRYASNYIRYHQKDKSRLRLSQDLMRRGIPKDIISSALDLEFSSDERLQISAILQKKRYPRIPGDEGEFRRTYQFLMRRGFKSHDILSVMKNPDSAYEQL